MQVRELEEGGEGKRKDEDRGRGDEMRLARTGGKGMGGRKEEELGR